MISAGLGPLPHFRRLRPVDRGKFGLQSPPCNHLRKVNENREKIGYDNSIIWGQPLKTAF